MPTRESMQIAEALLQNVEYIGRCYGTPYNCDYRENLIHDLALRIDHEDLLSGEVELLDRHRRIIGRIVLRVEAASLLPACDHAKSMEIPVLGAGAVASLRPLWHNRGLTPANVLRLRWSAAEKLAELDLPVTFASSHRSGKISGGFALPEGSRVNIRVTRSGPQYAFGAILGPDGENLPAVFLHPRNISGSERRKDPFSTGETVSAVVIHCAAGVQGREIRRCSP